MKINEITDVIEKYVPLSLSVNACKKLSFKDNSGYIINLDNQTESVLFALDLNDLVVKKAVELNAGLIITHHPAIFFPIKNIYDGAIAQCIKNNISVYSTHLSLDIANGGIEDNLATLLGAKESAVLQLADGEFGFGRTFEVATQTNEQFVLNAVKNLNAKNYMFFGDLDETCSKVSSFCGSGLSDDMVFASTDSDILVSADCKHNVILTALSKGKSVLQLTHYASENKPFEMFFNMIKNQLTNIKLEFFTDERFL